jgi:maltose O-acetyltransferase
VTIIGTVPPTVEVDLALLNGRNVTLDCRGTLKIHHDTYWGWNITVITMGHDIREGITPGFAEPALDRPVIIDRMAWICSGAMLYGCHIGEGAIVAFGAVVRAQDVKPYVMVAGNPARVIARWDGKTWKYLAARKFEVLE